MNIDEYLRFYKLNNTNREVEEILVTFEELLNLFGRFIVGGVSLKTRLEDISGGYVINPDTQNGNVTIRFKEDGLGKEYACPSGMDEVLKVCLMLLAGEKVIRCSDRNLSGTCFEYVRQCLSDFSLFSDGEITIRPKMYDTYFIYPYLDTELDVQSLNWLDVERIVLPTNIDAQNVYDLIKRNVIIFSSQKVSKVAQQCLNEMNNISEIGGKVIDLYECLGEKSDELLEVAIVLDKLYDTTDKVMVGQFANCQNRFNLLKECYDTVVKESEGFDYILVSDNGVTKDSFNKLVGYLCAVLSIFDKKAVIMDSNLRCYQYYRNMMFELSKGNFLSPYYQLKRFSGIKNDLESDSLNNFRFSLIRDSKLNDTIAFPVSIENNKECYLFPLKVFTSFSVDKSLMNNVSRRERVHSTLMMHKYSSLVYDLSIDKLEANKCARLILPENFNEIYSEGFSKDFKNSYGKDNYDVRKICSVSEQLGSKIIFEEEFDPERDSDKLVLHDWVLNSAELEYSWLVSILKYFVKFDQNPNGKVNKSVLERLKKVLGSEVNNYESSSKILYECKEWTNAEKPIKDGEESKAVFASSNYEKCEFYSCVCDIISHLLFDFTGKHKYVTLHDLVLCSKVSNEGTYDSDYYIMYYPMNPEMRWASVTHKFYTSQENMLEELKEFDIDEESKDNGTAYLRPYWDLDMDASLVFEGIPDYVFTRSDDEQFFDLCSGVIMLGDLFDKLDLNSIRCDTSGGILVKNKLELKKDKILSMFIRDNGNLDITDEVISRIGNEYLGSSNVMDYGSYFSSDELKKFSELAIWFISTSFIGEKCLTSDLKITVMEYGYSQYYNVKGYENLDELSHIVNPEKHLYYSRVINPFGGVLRIGRIGEFTSSKDANEIVFCCTSSPEDSFVTQIISNRYISDSDM